MTNLPESPSQATPQPETDAPVESRTRSAGPRPALLIFVLFPVIGLAAGLLVALNSRPEASAPVTPAPVVLPPAATQPSWSGEAAPDFELATLDGTTASLSDYRGRIVFLNFWATWCVPCERELPTFRDFMRQQPDDGPVVLAVNLGEPLEQVQAYLDEREINGFPVLLDVDYAVGDRYAIGPIPVTFVIDGQGTIRRSKYGEMSEDDLIDYLSELGP